MSPDLESRVVELRAQDRYSEFQKSVILSAEKLIAPLFPLFWFVDIFHAPDHKYLFLILRLSVIPFCFLLGHLIRKIPNTRQGEYLALFLLGYPSFLITFMSIKSDGIASPYYAGLNLMAAGAICFFPWSKLFLGYVVTVIYAPYFLYAAFSNVAPNEMKTFLINSFFMVSSIAISITIRSFYEKLKLKEVISRASLEREIENRDSLTKDLQSRTNELEGTLSQLKKAQANLIQSEKLASLGILTSGISHELNNSLNFVSGGLRSFERNLDKIAPCSAKDKMKEVFEPMKEGLDLSIEIISNLRAYSGGDQGAFTKFKLLDAANTVLAILRVKITEAINVSLSIPEDLWVTVSHAGMNQLLMNILSNAIDAIKGKGTIKIQAQLSEKYWELSVWDSGEGIPKEIINKIFDPFFTTKVVGKGMGLGLYVVINEVKRHSGEIAVESEPGEGTTFRFKFPLNAPIHQEKI